MMFRLDYHWMLFGLFALAIPVLLHLLPRRHHDIIDWGAMQFLPDSISTQRRRWLDEILLMLLRMAMITLIVVALASPIATSGFLGPLGDRASSDIVIILDGSYSMDVRVPNQRTPWEDALTWTRNQIRRERPGDRVSIIIARAPPLWLHENAIEDKIIKPRGNPDMPGTLAEAWKHLQTNSTAARKEIIVATDGQRHGWADLATLAALDNLGDQWHADIERAKNDGLAVPSLRIVRFGADLPKVLPNYALAPLTPSRGVAKVGQKISFQSALHLDGFTKYQPPRQVRVEIDGKPVQNLALPEKADLKKGQIPLTFQHRFEKEGPHVVSLFVEADDALAADNAQHVVVEIVKELPILLVDGDAKLSAESSSFFLQRALAAPQAVPYSALSIQDADRPAVIVLADVPRLEAAQIDALDRFLADGGGLLIVAGERVAKEKTFYNERLYRQGQGWLPAKLGDIGFAKDGVQPEPRSFQHTALELFRVAPDGSMNQVRFTKWWKVPLGPRDRATAIASLTNGDPFLVEKPYKLGRVILCTVPLDRRWNSTLPSTPEFPILVNELAFYLAGGRTGATTLRDGAPIRIDATGSPPFLTLHTPEIAEKTIRVKGWPWVYDDTGAIGVYRVEVKDRSWAFVVPPDLREADLTRCSEDDWKKVRGRLPVVWQVDGAQDQSVAPQESQREELWWLLLIGVIGLLCTEVWMTRRMVLARGR